MPASASFVGKNYKKGSVTLAQRQVDDNEHNDRSKAAAAQLFGPVTGN
jgi:hypothetical protein